MQAWVLSLLIQLFQSKPVQDQITKWKAEIIAFIEAQAAQILAAIAAQLTTWLPIFIKTIVTGIAQSAGQLVVNTEDKITDIIPGKIDDQILDPIVTNTLDKLGDLIGIKLR
jgi:hypothetical protein